MPWTVACQVPLSINFFRKDDWSGLPFPSPEDLPNPETEPTFPALQADSLPSEPPWVRNKNIGSCYCCIDILPVSKVRASFFQMKALFSGLLHLCPLCLKFSSPVLCMASSHPSGLNSDVTSSEKPSLTTLPQETFPLLFRSAPCLFPYSFYPSGNSIVLHLLNE